MNKHDLMMEAQEDFLVAQTFLSGTDMTLRQCSPVHYQIIHGKKKWIVNLYPTTGKQYAQPPKKCPKLPLGKVWTLSDAARMVVQLESGVKQSRSDDRTEALERRVADLEDRLFNLLERK